MYVAFCRSSVGCRAVGRAAKLPPQQLVRVGRRSSTKGVLFGTVESFGNEERKPVARKLTKESHMVV